jgi:hypothetical protein
LYEESLELKQLGFDEGWVVGLELGIYEGWEEG